MKIKIYLLKNLGAPFIIGFQVLILICAFFLTQRNWVMADKIGIYAYYMLVIGVILQLISFYKDGKRAEQEEKT